MTLLVRLVSGAGWHLDCGLLLTCEGKFARMSCSARATRGVVRQGDLAGIVVTEIERPREVVASRKVAHDRAASERGRGQAQRAGDRRLPGPALARDVHKPLRQKGADVRRGRSRRESGR